MSALEALLMQPLRILSHTLGLKTSLDIGPLELTIDTGDIARV